MMNCPGEVRRWSFGADLPSGKLNFERAVRWEELKVAGNVLT